MAAPDKATRLCRLRGDLDLAQRQVAMLFGKESVFKRLVEIMSANPNLQRPNRFFTWLFACYAESASIAIRRLLDEDERSASLGSVVRQLCQEPELITRDEYVGELTRGVEVLMTDGSPKDQEEALRQTVEHHQEQEARDLFRPFGCHTRGMLCPAKLRSLLDEAKTKCDKVRKYVNKRVAHYDSRPPNEVPTWRDLDDAVDAVGKLFQGLHLLLRGSPYELTWTWQGEDWEWIFTVPWASEPSEQTD